MVDAETSTIIACHDCDLLHRLPERATGTMLCSRCGAVLRRKKPETIERSLAWTTAALILFVLSNSFPFLAMKSGGFVQETTLLTGIHELWKQELHGLAILVLLTCVLVPLVQMLGLLYILVPLQGGLRPAAHAGHVYRLVQEIAPWGMMEVFMMGILVALVKLGHMATIVPGISVFSFGVLIFVLAAAFSSLDPVLIWDRLDQRR
jgi:paraquat-inducible protein A